jgi:hypothetical protein
MRRLPAVIFRWGCSIFISQLRPLVGCCFFIELHLQSFYA